MVERVAIIGIGVIGGSIALAWKERLPALHVIGYDKPQILEDARQRGIIDHQASSLSDAVSHADVVFIAVPLDLTKHVMESIAPHLPLHTIVTDVGSVKQPVIENANRLLPESTCFIGGHPMTGSELSGLEGADAFLFENSLYILCPEESVDPKQYSMVEDLIEATGARVVSINAATHDKIVASVSHLPQLVATTLVNVASDQHLSDALTLQLAAGGFRDMTRIASSSFDMWASVLEQNSSEVEIALTSMIDHLDFIRHQLTQQGGIQTLRPIFERASAVREEIPRDFKGFLRPLCDVFVYAKDQPGVLAHITGTLFSQDISIKDIELLKIREGTGGAFRISLEDEQSADAAVNALNSHGCRAHRIH
ncbi:MAG: prephenate dehydrogenase/arogenate dehydrogenase family protein [Bacteroidetes bacterium]|nr:prephenate dehydrogenase/arogenate dehydrogenase family protein [Bacteroidota bacterium]